jgi:hypothetical protein
VARMTAIIIIVAAFFVFEMLCPAKTDRGEL